MKYVVIILLTFFVKYAIAQTGNYKVDSVFNLYFTALDIDVNKYSPEQYPEYFEEHVIESNDDTLYLSKYVTTAITFLQKISKINAPVRPSNTSYLKPLEPYATAEMIAKWKEWYNENKAKLIWSEVKKEPVMNL